MIESATVGNHEFYGCESLLQSECELREQVKAFPNIHFLQCDEIIVHGIRFLGCTGWSQMTSCGLNYQELVMETAEVRISDFSLIKVEGLAFTARDCVSLGKQESAWLERQLAINSKEPTIVITHFAPALEFRNKRFPVDVLSGYFCNDYIDLIEAYSPKAWIFGHTHYNVNKHYDNTHVLSNQHGYGRECPDYDANFMIEI